MFWRLPHLCILTLLQNSLAYFQNDYDVILDIVHLEFYNRTYYSSGHLGRTWFNRTTRVVSGNFTLIKETGWNLKADIQLYKFASNEYRFFPITMTLNICEEYKKNTFGAMDLLTKCSNLGPCPYKKNRYFVNNCSVDFSQFPPYIPRGKYKLEVKMYNNRDLIAKIHPYVTIEDKKKQRYIQSLF